MKKLIALLLLITSAGALHAAAPRQNPWAGVSNTYVQRVIARLEEKKRQLLERENRGENVTQEMLNVQEQLIDARQELSERQG